MIKHARFLYQPVMPLGKNRTFVTGCKAHKEIAKQTAAEGTVLLKNDGTLPLKQGARICLFGRGAGDFIFGGGGSGNVHTNDKINLAQGLQAAADRGEIQFFSKLIPFYEAQREKEIAEAKEMGIPLVRYDLDNPRHIPVLPEALYNEAKAFGNTAIFCLSRFSTEHTLKGDRKGGKGDFTMHDEEKELIEQLSRDFDNVIVILNVCGPVATKEYAENPGIGAVLYPMFSGSVAGEVLTDILLGKRYPSGHLQDTLAVSIDDYPTTETFRESLDYVSYTEDIFVGYRYFETFAQDKVVYPYGFGLSYTTFCVTKEAAVLEKNTVKLAVKVKNTGSFAGKEVVQAYMTAPQGKLGKAAKVLCAFGKTKELAPGEETVLKLHFDIRQFGSFDDLGKICKSAFLLEKGEYVISVGTNVRQTRPYLTFVLDTDVICKQCHSYLSPRALPERLTADGTMEKLPVATPATHKPVGYKLKQTAPEEPISLVSALEEDKLDSFIAGMTDEEKGELLYGHPIVNAADTNGIGMFPREKRFVQKVPMIPTADGPAGLRIWPGTGLNPIWFPCGNVISQTWNPEFARKIGIAAAREVKENNVGIWLAPALNIHRSPLCGRNFEYYSEDPLISGVFAAAAVKGIQSQKIAATVKHFCANNKEVNRKQCDSRVSERALREIYLRGFEIVVKTAKPWALMTSYNAINGVRCSANWESINGVLRGEWKYEGLVMTDWWAFTHLEDEVHAGSDVKMPEMITSMWDGKHEDHSLADLMAEGKLDKGAVNASVKRILAFMDHLE